MTNTASPGVDIRQATPGPGNMFSPNSNRCGSRSPTNRSGVQQEPITDEEHEIVLHADRPGVDTEAVPMNETG